jgi:hypothetical protein
MASMQQKRIFTSVRPARVAVVIDQADQDWRSSCLRIIEFLSSTWGGAYNIIVPTDGTTISPRFWQILDVFDADYLYFYYKTGRDLKTNHPDEYEQWLQEEINKFAAGGPIGDPESTRRQIDELLLDVDFVEEPSAILQAELIRKLAPLHIAEHAFEKGIAAGSFPDFPLAPITKVVPNSESKPNVVVYDPKYGGIFPLWLASVVGLAPDRLTRELTDLGLSVSTISTAEYDSFDVVVEKRSLTSDRNKAGLATPFEIANINCALYRSIKSHSREGPMVLVAGDTLSDFCLYYSLSRLRNDVVWLPHEWLRASKESPESKKTLLNQFVRAVAQLSRISRLDSDPKFVMMSESLGQPHLQSVVEDLDRSRSFGFVKFEDSTSISYSIETLLAHPLRLYERDNVFRPSALTVQEGSQIDFFETPKPKNFVRIDPYEHRWISEVNVRSHQLPRQPFLGEWVVKHPVMSSNGARIAKSGISYFCPNSFYAGGDIDTSLIRPTLFVPDAFQVFEHLFQKIGYSVSLSDKGFFARDTINKLGELSTVGSLLRSAGFRALLLKFLDHVKPDRGVHDEGTLLNDKRRYMNFPSIAKVIGNDDVTKQSIEALLTGQVLQRGFIFKCRFCRNADWFSLEETSQSFKCKRCGRSQQISSQNYWYGMNEPGWYYKLDEIVYQFLRHNGYVTLLALDHLRSTSEESFLYIPDLELTKRDAETAEMELDILCIRDGVLTLGEAKKENQLGKTKREELLEIEKYQRLAEQIGAEALVFATFADGWSNSTIRRIRDTTPTSQKVTLLKQSDLIREN